MGINYLDSVAVGITANFNIGLNLKSWNTYQFGENYIKIIDILIIRT